MSKFFKPIKDSKEWRWLLAKPRKHWKEGYSAKLLADCWQGANDFPKSVKKVSRNSGIELFKNIQMLISFPEYKVALPPRGGRPSQNDIFILAKGNKQLITVAVEGKALEPFGDIVDEWKYNFTKGKQIRLTYLCDLLQLDKDNIGHIRYQLLHRTASAIILAEQFNAKNALMLVHSFKPNPESFEDYQRFLQLYGVRSEEDAVQYAKRIDGIKLFFGWVNEEQV